MVAQTVELPNIRKMFIPDDGYVIIDCDLERADAQVVAWDSGAEKLKEIFRQGLDIHTENAKSVFNTDDITKDMRHKAKAGVHAVNYVVKARTLASTLKVSVAEADAFINSWFKAHPEIKEWHRRIQHDLEKTRSIKNAFGYRRYYFDRIENLLSEATAWIPQSTVAIVTNYGLINLEKNLPQVELLIQVHDSLVMQCPKSEFDESMAKEIIKNMMVEIPYDDPLTIPVNLSWSYNSWGDCQKTKFANDNLVWEDGSSIDWPCAA